MTVCNAALITWLFTLLLVLLFALRIDIFQWVQILQFIASDDLRFRPLNWKPVPKGFGLGRVNRIKFWKCKIAEVMGR